MAVVTAGQLRQVADPNRPADHAFESPGSAVERILVPLGEATHVAVVGGPTNPNGDVYWQVADLAFPGCCAPFGWVRATQSSGEPALAPYAPDCPDRSSPVDGNKLYALGLLEAATCYGDDDFNLRGYVVCGQPIVDSFLTIAGPGWTHNRTLCNLDDAVSIYGPAATALYGLAPSGQVYSGTVDMGAHFNDPSSDSCRWAPGTFMSITIPDDAPANTAQFACRTSIYVTSATPQP